MRDERPRERGRREEIGRGRREEIGRGRREEIWRGREGGERGREREKT